MRLLLMILIQRLRGTLTPQALCLLDAIAAYAEGQGWARLRRLADLRADEIEAAVSGCD